MAIQLRELLAHLGGDLVGDPEREVTGIAPLDAAGSDHVSFLSNPRLRAQAAASAAAALILTPADSERLGSQYAGARILVDHPYAYFARAAQWFASLSAPPRVPGVHATAAMDPTATVAASACIGPHVTVEAGAVIGERCVIDSGSFVGRDAVVGADTHFHAQVCFHAGCVIGERGILHSGAVIGADGFGFANEDGVWSQR